jgi:hypothetical protein
VAITLRYTPGPPSLCNSCRSHLATMRREMAAEVDRLQAELEHKRAMHAQELHCRSEEERLQVSSARLRILKW